MRRVHRLILIFLAALGLAFAAPAVAPAKAEAYLHLANATDAAISFVRYDVCDGWVCTSVSRQSYSRQSDTRINLYMRVERASGRVCNRWMEARGNDSSFSVVYFSGSVWNCTG